MMFSSPGRNKINGTISGNIRVGGVDDGLFDAPFSTSVADSGLDNDNTYVIPSSNSMYGNTALRRRENDSFASPTYNIGNNHNSLYYTTSAVAKNSGDSLHEPQHHYYTSSETGNIGGFGESATPVLPGLFFQNRRRMNPLLRKNQKLNNNNNTNDNGLSQQHQHDKWIKFAMKGVLLSPVIVLIVWSIAAIAFTHKQVLTTTNNNNTNNSNGNRKAMVADPSIVSIGNSRQQQHQQQHQKKNRFIAFQQAGSHWFGRNQQQQQNLGAEYSNSNNNYSPVLVPPMARGASEEVRYESPIIVTPNKRGSGALPLIVQPPNLYSMQEQQQQQLYYNNFPIQGGIENNQEMQQQLQQQIQIVNTDLFATFVPGHSTSTMQQQQQYYGNSNIYVDESQQQQLQEPQVGHVNAYYNSFKKGNIGPPLPWQGLPQQQQQRQPWSRGERLAQFFTPAQRQSKQFYGNANQYGQTQQLGRQQSQYDYYEDVPPQGIHQLQGRRYSSASGGGYSGSGSGSSSSNGGDDPLVNPPPIGEFPGVVDQQLLGQAAAEHYSSTNYLRRGSKAKNNNVRYYFYDPHASIRNDVTGEISIPATVYDVMGRAVPFHIVSSSAKEIYMEPPKMGSSSSTGTTKYYVNSTSYNSTTSSNITYTPTTLAPTSNNATNTTVTTTWVHPNVVHTPVYDHHKQMVLGMSQQSSLSRVIGQVPEWGDSTSTDRTIIICTVGIMALLVGAISARRMRSRSVLSMCIENESLEDDVAYDTAYTVPVSSGGDNQYHTFGSHNSSINNKNHQGWKGDLEKFDV